MTTPQSAHNGVSTERTGHTGDPGGSANTYAASGQVGVTFNTIQLTKAIVATSEAHTGLVTGTERVAIGEIVRYRLVVQLPEASVTNLQLRDRLPTGLRFLNDGTAKVAFVANQTGISSTTITPALPGCSGLNITGNSGNVTPTCPLPDTAVSRSATTNDDNYGSGDDPYFKLGDVTNSDSDADNEFIVVEFNAVVENITGNQAFNNATGAASATTRSNDFQFLADTTTVGTSGSVSVRIAEPVIRNLSKTVLTAPGDAGDTVVYRLTYGNTASGADAAAAFDIVITDVLNTNLVFQNITGSTTGGACGSTPSTFSGSAVGQTVTATVTCLNPGGTVTIDITAQVIGTAVAGTTIPNTANLVYTSLPGSGTAGNPTGSTTPGPDGSATGERNGADGSGGLNDYVSTSSINTTLNRPTLSKLAPTPTQYTIGETIAYNLRVTLPEGTTQNLRLTDVLPTGLGYVSHQVITMAAASGGLLSADYNGVLPSPTCTGCTVGASGTLTFTFGNVQTNGSGPGNGTSNNQFLLRVVARVLNITGNQQGTTRQNTADLIYDDPTLGANRTVAGGSQTITVIEPQITATKTVAPTGGVQAGNTLTYSFTLTNTGNSPAYDVTVLDTLAQGVGFTALVSCVLQPGNVTLLTQTTILGNTVTFDGIPAGSWDIPVGGSITCTYTALALSTLFVNGPHTNTIDADWSSLNGVSADERVYDDTPGITVDGSQDSASATFTVNAPTFAKSDGGVAQATIGDTVFYTLTITSPLGVIRNLTVQDVLPAGLIYNGNQAVSGISTVPVFTTSAPNDGSAPVTLTWNFGNATVVASPATITFSATVANVIGNQQGQTRTNTASLAHHNALGTPQTALTAADAFVLVEPVLSVSKSVVPPLPVDAGDPVTYTITIAHAGTSGANAFDVVVLDPIPAHLVNPVVASVTAVGIPTPSTEITGGALRVPALADGSFDLPLGASVTVTLRADLAQTVGPNQSIVNTAAVTWSSQNGSPPQERTSGNGLLGGGGLNDYELQGSVGLNSGGYTITKSVLATSAAHTTGADVTIGEVVTYTLLITLPEGTMPSLQVIDLVPAGMAYVGGSVSVNTSGFGGSVPTPTVIPSGNGADGQDVQITFGTITVTADNNPANNSFAITLAMRVLNVPGNSGLPANQTSLPNAATLQVGIGSVVSSNTVILDVVEPLMTVTKTITPPQAAANEVVTVTLFVQNAGLADAFDVVLSDALPTGLSFQGGLTHVSGVAPSGLNQVGNTVTATWSAIPDGAGSTIRFLAKLAGNVTAGQVIVNQATVTQATTLPGNVAGERQEPPATGADDVTVVAPNVTLNKDDGQTTAYAGEVIIYTLLVGNAGQALAPNVVITETVPLHTTFNAGASSSGWSCSHGAPGGTVCTYTVGNLAAGSSTTVDFAVTVVDPLAPSVTAITNQATAADDGSRGADPNPANNTDDDTNTLLVGRIGDRVWHDLNGNGLQDGGEPGLANVTVRLYRSGDPTPLLTTTTDGNGLYSFANLAPGNYVVEFVPPSGYAFTYPDVGSNDAVDSDANPTNGRTGVITLAVGGTILSVDAGLYLPVSIGDFIFFDGNGNGIQDGGETVGLSGIVITVTNLGTSQVYTTTSGPTGAYLFATLPPGTYQVSAPPSAPGLLRTTPSPQLVTLTSGGVYLAADFGYIAPTAVTLVGFTAAREGSVVWVRWQTWNEHDLEGFIVLRSETLTGARVPVSPLIPASNRAEGATYAWPDPNAGAGTVWYWLEVRPDGQVFGPIPALAEGWGRVFFPRLRR
ncbi:MAG: isopeptide-forming domain-containing fimbrial protein [Anaerolineae bacterium]|nr:isopeptide-forming domain-containing fimbrial protein [Anaerolineae bacterium]